MKNLNTSFLALVLGLTIALVGCGERSSEAESGPEELTGTENGEEIASPLRTAKGQINNKEVRVQYGSPSIRNRIIWGDLVPYDEVWRTGANEATFVEFSQDVTVEGKPLKAGKYSLFTIPKEDGPWTVIFNEQWDLKHGHFQYNQEHDVLRVEAIPKWETNSRESLHIAVEQPGIVIKWEKVSLPISVE